MKIKISITIIVAAALFGNLLAQNKSVLKVQMERPTIDQLPLPPQVSESPHKSAAINPGQELFKTDYDYMCNNAIDNMIDLCRS
jgi:hypothetical protein